MSSTILGPEVLAKQAELETLCFVTGIASPNYSDINGFLRERMEAHGLPAPNVQTGYRQAYEEIFEREQRPALSHFARLARNLEIVPLDASTLVAYGLELKESLPFSLSDLDRVTAGLIPGATRGNGVTPITLGQFEKEWVAIVLLLENALRPVNKPSLIHF